MSEPAKPTALSLCSIDELYTELKARYPNFVACGLRKTSEYIGTEEPIHRIIYAGDYFVLLGLLAEASMLIRAEHAPCSVSERDDEEGDPT